jgi:hypothetical protein
VWASAALAISATFSASAGGTTRVSRACRRPAASGTTRTSRCAAVRSRKRSRVNESLSPVSRIPWILWRRRLNVERLFDSETELETISRSERVLASRRRARSSSVPMLSIVV